MNQKIVNCVLLLMIVLGLEGCGDAEKKAQLELDRAQVLRQSGELIQAEGLFRGIVQNYPKTAVATEARSRLEELERVQKQATKILVDTLESLVQVVEGYRSIYGEYPPALEDLDASGYFFDSAYMAGIVPDSVTVYLVLDGEAQKFQVWAYDETIRIGVSISGESRLENFYGAEAIVALQSAYLPAFRLGNLVSLAVAEQTR